MVKDYIVSSLPLMPNQGRSKALMQMHKEIQDHCVRQLFKLTSPRYGYTISQLAEMGLNAGPALDHDAAVRVLGATIKHSSEIYFQYFQSLGTIQKTATMEIFEKVKNFRAARDGRSC